jgi:hypothetical protein
MGHGVVAAIALGVSRVTEEDTRDGTRGEFMGCGGGDTGVTTTTEDPKTIVRRRGTEQEMVRCVIPAGAARTEVNKEGGGGEGVGPESGRDVCVEKEGADTVVEGAENALGAAVLLRGIWTGETENSAVRGKKGANGDVIELLAVVGLEGMNRTTELSGHVSIEGNESGGDVGLLTEGKRPHKMRKIIKNN